MNHDLASEKLLELAYGELPPREARDVEAHVADCERCREELARIGETRSLMANLPVEPAPERGEGIIMAAAREAAEARSRRRPTLLPPWLWAGSIGAVAAVVVAVVSWQLTREPIRPSLRQDSELMGSARPAVSAPTSQPAAAPAPPSPQREPVAKAKALADPQPPSEEAKGAVGFAEAKSDRAEEAEAARGAGGLGIMGARHGSLDDGAASESRALPATSRADDARGAAGYAMADAKKSAPSAPPMRSAEPKAVTASAAKADAEAEARRFAGARSAERKATAKAAAALRPRQAPGTVEVRKFASCPGERRRVVEYASDGSLLRYLRDGDVRSVEQLFDPDGRLVAAFAFERGVRRALPLDLPGLARDASDAGIDAPPRCGP